MSAPFAYRTVECDDCHGSRVEYGMFGGGPYPCEGCGGLGWTDKACAECGDDAPLNDAGLCERCAEPDAGLVERHRDWLIEHGFDPKSGRPRVAA
jgi:hypothetical protein